MPMRGGASPWPHYEPLNLELILRKDQTRNRELGTVHNDCSKGAHWLLAMPRPETRNKRTISFVKLFNCYEIVN